MAKQAPKKLNRLEQAFKKRFDKLLFDCEVKFTKVLPALRENLPTDKSSDEYKSINRSEYLKLLRASFSFKEVVDMLKVLNHKVLFKVNKTSIIPAKYILEDDIKVKYTEVMAVCELFGIDIEWVEKPKK